MAAKRERKIGTYEVPFIGGRMLEYGHWDTTKVQNRPNEPFVATMKLNGHWRGRSSARVGLVNVENDEKYSTGFAAFYDMVAEGKVADGRVSGRWQVKKQGSNYILIRLGDV